MPTKVDFIILVAQYSETDCRYAFVLQSVGIFKGILKPLENLKNWKTGRVPYLGLELAIHVVRSQIHLVRQSL